MGSLSGWWRQVPPGAPGTEVRWVTQADYRRIAHAIYTNVTEMVICGARSRSWRVATADLRSCKQCVNLMTQSGLDTTRS